MFLFLLTTSCTKVDYDLNPFTTVLNHVIKGEINGKKEKGPIIPGEKNDFDHGTISLKINFPFTSGRFNSIESILNLFFPIIISW